MQSGQSVLSVKGVPEEVQRGIRMVTARRRLTVRSWVISSLYQLLDEELTNDPEWRYQTTRRGEEKEILRDPRESSRRGRKQADTSDPEVVL